VSLGKYIAFAVYCR